MTGNSVKLIIAAPISFNSLMSTVVFCFDGRSCAFLNYSHDLLKGISLKLKQFKVIKELNAWYLNRILQLFV